jgi:hypothetical protein
MIEETDQALVSEKGGREKQRMRRRKLKNSGEESN